jgi:hypothetical protein
MNRTTFPTPAPAARGHAHRASYLVLFGDQNTPRAALFNTDEQLMAEMIGDDGYAVDSLVRSGTVCAAPAPAMLAAIGTLDRGVDPSRVRCIALG